MKNVLVTGGCGFIGSAFLNYMLSLDKYNSCRFVNLDKLDYCGREKNVEQKDNYIFVKGDICDGYLILKLLNQYNIDTVINFAAYSHVDNSFDNSISFTENNVLGTHHLLESCRIWGNVKKIVHVSTDEVYGDIPLGTSNEESPLSPTNPYSASKAAAEMLVLSYKKSFNMPIIITRGNNVYGPRQYPEKLIPKFITNLLTGKPCPIHGNGLSKRSFIHCDDISKAFMTILEKGVIGEIYNIGSNDEYSVLEIWNMLKEAIDPIAISKNVEDRVFNDPRYLIDCSKLQALGWKQEITFLSGLLDTITWYKENLNWFD